MNQRDVIKRIERHTRCSGRSRPLVKHGGRHHLYDLDGVMIPISRHQEISEQLAQIIWKECGGKLGKGWSRR